MVKDDYPEDWRVQPETKFTQNPDGTWGSKPPDITERVPYMDRTRVTHQENGCPRWVAALLLIGWGLFLWWAW